MHISKNQQSIIRLVLGAASLVVLVIFELLNITNLWVVLPVFAVGFISVGLDIVKEGVEQIIKGDFIGENLLMSIAVISAVIIGEYTESIAVLVFYTLGEMLEDAAKDKSRRSVENLMSLTSDTAVVMRNNTAQTVESSTVAVGETIIIDPFVKVPLDCVITNGEGEADLSKLTGESLPKTLRPGDKLLSGSINGGTRLVATVTSDYDNSTASIISKLIQSAAERKTPRERFITRFSKIYTPIVVLAAVVLAAVPPIFGQSFIEYFKRALVFLVASCPCALVISVPLAYVCAIAAASKKGVLIKGTSYLEALAAVDSLYVDKTGTLTQGKFEITKVEPHNITRERLLEICAVCESGSHHPIASAFTPYNTKGETAAEITEQAGYGISAKYKNNAVLIGSRELLEKNRISIPKLEISSTAVLVAINGEYAGFIEFSDILKPDSAAATAELMRSKIDVIMLTGDSDAAAQNAAKQLNITNYKSRMMPGDKLETVEKAIKEGKTVAFAGDGVNDAPVLKLSSVGIAMGKGTDAAIEAADVVAMNNCISDIVTARRISKKAVGISTANLILILIVKAAVLISGALGLAGMWVAVFADVGVLIITVLNALRCLRIKR